MIKAVTLSRRQVSAKDRRLVWFVSIVGRGIQDNKWLIGKEKENAIEEMIFQLRKM